MKEKLRKLYQNGENGASPSISATGLLNAIAKDWISVHDAIDIVGDDKAMEVLLSAKLKEISTACNNMIVAGIDLELGNETVHFNLSIEDQSNISNLFRVVELGGTEFIYQSEGGVCRVYSATEIAQIYIAAQSMITTQTTYHNELKSYVQSLNTTEDIIGVEYGMELPEPYLTEMGAKLAVASAQMEMILARLSG